MRNNVDVSYTEKQKISARFRSSLKGAKASPNSDVDVYCQ